MRGILGADVPESYNHLENTSKHATLKLYISDVR